MTSHLWSRYHFRYPQTLAYMLQVCEYKIGDYLVWYHQTKNFTRVEQRKQFMPTLKGLAVLVVAWAIVLICFGLAIAIIWPYANTPRYMSAALIVLLTPYILAYAILIPLVAVQILIQKPIELIVAHNIKRTLRSHTAIKIGVAGSFGKTTMREILKTVLAEGKVVAAPPHNYNTILGINKFVKSLSGNEDILIFELGEYYPGDVRMLCELTRPTIGIITGINEAHLQKFKSIDQTVKTIYELSEYLGNGTVYVNGENDLARSQIAPHHIVYDRNHIGDWQITNQYTDLSGTSFVIEMKDAKLDIKSGLLGLHQIGPLAVAAYIAINLGLSPTAVQAGISKTKPFAHRLEPKIDASEVTILDDSYNGNPDGVRAVIDFLASLRDHRRFYVTPGLVELGSKTKEVHHQIGLYLANTNIEKVILIKNSVTQFIAGGLSMGEFRGDILWFNNSLEALAALPYLTIAGDVVLLQNDWSDQYQ